MVDVLPAQAKIGRGAVSAPEGRFEKHSTALIDDGWSNGFTDEPAKITTTLHIDTSRHVINEIDSPDLMQMRSINPYRGCEHGCIYCFARPSHSYLGFSPGLDFETEIFYKPAAPELLAKELAAKSYQPQTITLGTNTDCYQPVERKLCLTRRIIEVLAAHNHPLCIITKSALVQRDLDLLAPMAEKGLARILVSLTTLDHDLARVMEPRTAAPFRRLETIRAATNAGVPVTVMAAPLIPALTDMEMEQVLEAAYDAGARNAHYTLVRLPYELKELFREWLHTYRPERAEHVLSLIRQMRGGKLYDAKFGGRQTGAGPYAELLAQRFKLAKKRIGYPDNHETLRKDLFRVPGRSEQLSLGLDG